jgi:glyoxylase-like metal-dependent hydrolase (beta-lactamase superfamily II)
LPPRALLAGCPLVLRVHSIEGNRQRLDGGAMFGNAPRALWSRWHEPDVEGRIELGCRTLLVDEGDRRILLETGIGAFFSPELRARYGVVEDEHVLLDALRRAGWSDTDIDVVVLSHLHFDHAGGLLSAWSADREPELLFPKARFVVSAAAFERARHPHPRDRASFIPGLVEKLVQSGRLCIVADASEAQALLGSRYRFRESHGHTPGMLHAQVVGESATLFFCADLVPGTAWVHVPITMGYDRYPELLVDEKAQILRELADAGTHLFFTHDPRIAAARIQTDESGRFSAVDSIADLTGWDLDSERTPRL